MGALSGVPGRQKGDPEGGGAVGVASSCSPWPRGPRAAACRAGVQPSVSHRWG